MIVGSLCTSLLLDWSTTLNLTVIWDNDNVGLFGQQCDLSKKVSATNVIKLYQNKPVLVSQLPVWQKKHSLFFWRVRLCFDEVIVDHSRFFTRLLAQIVEVLPKFFEVDPAHHIVVTEEWVVCNFMQHIYYRYLITFQLRKLIDRWRTKPCFVCLYGFFRCFFEVFPHPIMTQNCHVTSPYEVRLVLYQCRT